MERIVLLSFVGVFSSMLSSATAWGQLITSDDFNYADNSLLTSNGWTAHSGGGTAPITVGASNGLTYPGYLGSGIGNAAKLIDTGEDDSKTFTAVTTGILYYSCLVKVDVVSAGFFVHLLNASTTFAARIFVQTSGGGFNFGISNSSTGTFGSTVFTLGTTYLCVVKYDVSTTGACSLWVFSSGVPASEIAAGTPEITNTGSGQASISAFALRQYSATQNYTIDGIRVGTTWNDAPLPVELDSFTALAHASKVELNWSTATEVNNYGFEIERASHNRLDGLEDWSKVGFVDGHGTTNAPQNYSYTDNIFATGAFSYRLKQIDRDGSFRYSNEVAVTSALTANDYHLAQNFPNPFNPSTTIRFAVKSRQRASLNVYNMLGQEVHTLYNQEAEAGVVYNIPFDGSKLSSGVYYYRLRIADHTELKKMLMLK